MTIHELNLSGRIPSKKNSKIFVRRGKRTFLIPSSNYVKWHTCASDEIKSQKVIWIEGVEEVQLEFRMPDNRKTDLTNKAESIMDLLVDCEVIEDDCWQQVPKIILSTNGVNKENPGVKIWIKSSI